MSRLPSDQDVRVQAAEDLQRNIFLDAGAGCGKTQALTARYLALLRAGLQVPEIVAVTFTNKAARDMKARLRKRCEEEAAQAETVEAAAEWQSRARQLENAPISTIHSFCSSLLRRHALRAEIDPAFTVMDDIAQVLLVEDAIRQTLLRRLDAEEPTAALAVSELGLAATLDAIDKLLRSREEQLADLQHPPSAEELTQRWEEGNELVMALRLDLLVQSPHWQRNRQVLMECVGAEAGDKLEQLRRSICDVILAAEDAGRSVEDRLISLRQLEKLGNVPSKGNGFSEEDQTQVADACRAFKNKGNSLCTAIRALCDPEPSDPLPAAELTAALYLEANEALSALTAQKAERSLLDYDDLQVITRDLLRDNAAVRQDCHERYRHVLIDEFQDTNELQRELLWLVAGAEPGGSPPPGRLFIVGDAKQSIYRFRDADVSVFNSVRCEFEQDTAACRRLRLAVTFRSHPALVDLHNALFLQPRMMGPDQPERPAYAAFYESLAAHRQPLAEPSCCDLLLTGVEGKVSVEEAREAEAAALAQWLKQAIGTLTVQERCGDDMEEARPATAGDFAMLFRSTTDLHIYERALRLAGLKYHVSAGRGFFTRQEILDLLNLLCALENWHDEIALAGALRSPLFSLSDETLFWLKSDTGSLHEALGAIVQERHPHQAQFRPEQLPRAQYAARQVAELHELKNRLPLSSLLGEILGRTGYTAAIAGLFDGDQQIGNLRKLIELAGGFENAGSYSLRDFVDYLRHLVTLEQRTAQAPVVEEEADCIKLLTIHGAKGLEWPIVMVPDLGRGDPPRGGHAWRYHRRYGLIACPQSGEERQWPILGELMQELNAAEERAETRRLLYVALTRCRDRLILSGSLNSIAADSWLTWLMGAMEVDCEEGACELPQVQVHLLTPPEATRAQRQQPAQYRGTVEPGEVARRVQPVPVEAARLSRFTVTGLSDYRHCPQHYRLRSLLGLPDEQPVGHLLAQDGRLAAVERGTIVHEALELVGREGEKRVQAALQQALAGRALEADEQTELAGVLQWYLEEEVYRRHVRSAKDLRSEVPLAFALGTAVVEGKLDAVAEEADGRLCVIDYKTGYESDAIHQPEHLFQLGLYCAGLQCLGHEVSGAFVIYLDRRAVMECPPAQFPETLREAERVIGSIRAGSFDRGPGAHCTRCRMRWACDLHQN